MNCIIGEKVTVSESSVKWQNYIIISGIFIFLSLIAAFLLKIWVITAIPIGFLFGFFLQKGDLCGSSA